MARTLTIVARGPDFPYSPSKPEGDAAIQAVCDKLAPLHNGTTYIFEHAVRVVDVKKLLELHKPGPDDLVQLIGHGATGKLWLGGHWTGTETKNGRAVLLDSNYNFYGLLLDCVPPKCRVWLLGCTIGATSRIADGPTLLFDLARMWRCDVSAPTDYVTDADFGADGIFTDANRLVHASQVGIQTASAISFPSLPSTTSPEPPPLVTIKKLLGLPMIGMYGLSPQPQLQPQLQRISALVGREVEASRLLAGAELQVEVSLGAQDVKGEIIGNLRLLRVRTTSRMRYFELDPNERKTMLTMVTDIVKSIRV